MPLINNSNELQKVIDNILIKAVDRTTDILLRKLEDIIDDVVYGWESPSDDPWKPNRTHEFQESWIKTKAIASSHIIQSDIFQDISVMKHRQNVDGKGNDVHDPDDVANLADIIISGQGYGFGYAEGIERDFWSKWIIYVDSNINNIFKDECKKLGLNLK